MDQRTTIPTAHLRSTDRSRGARPDAWSAVGWVIALLWLVVSAVLPLLGDEPDRISIISVDDFGARANDGIDDGEAVRAALEEASGASHPVTVRFPSGRYDIDSPSADGPFLVLRSAEDVSVVGTDAEIVFARPERDGLALQDSADVRIEGLTFDYETPPFAQGVVVDVDVGSGTLDLRVADGFPGLDSAWFAASRWGTRHDPISGRLVGGTSDLHAIQIEASPLSDRTWRVGVTNGLADVSIGDGFVIPIRGLGSAVVVSGSTGTTLSDLTVHSAPGSAFTTLGSDGTVLEGSSVSVRPGSRRWVSVSGDGFHHSGGSSGPVVQGNSFTRMLDDGVNIYSVPAIVREVETSPGGPMTVTVDRPFEIREGQMVEFFDAVAGIVRGRGVVSSVDQVMPGTWRLSLEHPVRGTDAQGGPEEADQMFVLDDVGTDFLVNGNTFADHRARGVVVRGRDGRVVDNVFRHLPAGVVVGNEPDWPEGNIPANILIDGNRFEDVAPSSEPFAAAIVVRATRLGDEVVPTPLIDSVTITNNRIDGAAVAISVGGTRHVRIVDTIVAAGDDGDPSQSPTPAVVVEHSEDVVVLGLTVLDTRAGDWCRSSGASLVIGADRSSRATLNGSPCDG